MQNEMKALVKSRPEPGLWMERVPVPEVGPADVLIKVKKSAICGTDVHIWKWDEFSAKTVPVPMVVGHEFVGEIVDCGPAATKYRIGQRVSGEGHIVCGACRNCRAGRGHLCRNTKGVGVNRPGSFAEYLCIPEMNVVPIPEDIPDEIAAIFDPFGNAVHTALSFDLVGEDVLVTGAAGGVGSVATAILANLGYSVAGVTGRPETEAYLKELGASRIVPRDELTEVTRKPLEREAWAGCVDAVAGAMLGRVLKQMNYGASVAAVGLAGGAAIEGALITPFILRGVNLLGIDSVMQPYDSRLRAWERIGSDLPLDKLEAMVQPATLSDLPGLGKAILKGQVKGRVVVDVNG